MKRTGLSPNSKSIVWCLNGSIASSVAEESLTIMALFEGSASFVIREYFEPGGRDGRAMMVVVSGQVLPDVVGLCSQPLFPCYSAIIMIQGGMSYALMFLTCDTYISFN